MFKIQCLLAYLTVLIGFVYSWDIAVTTGDQIEFYSNQTKIGNEGVRFRDLTALAYDAVHNMLLFVDKQNDNASIFSYNLAKKESHAIVRRKAYEDIQGLAFDPITRKVFWTDTIEKSIFWKSLKDGSKENMYGNLLIKMDDEVPRAIAVDSCREYIYWTNINITKPTIERARFDGSERTVIVSSNIYKVVSLAIDQQSKRIYWAEKKEGIHYAIESSDLDGKNRKILLLGTNHMPETMTVSKDSIYWVDHGYKTVWKLPKNPLMNTEPEDIIKFPNEVPFGIVANYKVEDQTANVPECAGLSAIAENKTLINDSFSIPGDLGVYCLHGVKVEGKFACKCSTGYIGERCEISVCNNFCFQGDCSSTPTGEAICTCNTGFTGKRCEVNLCEGYCLNNGVCSIGSDQKPACKCLTEYDGDRCENVTKNKTVMDPVTIPKDLEVYCLHGVKVEGKSSCKCSAGYTGEHCEISVCHNFCLRGDCSLTTTGEATCKCNTGFAGKRCEVNLCVGHCLNNGVCSIGSDQKPMCKCLAQYKGDKCEVYHVSTSSVLPSVHCNCTKETNSSVLPDKETSEVSLVNDAVYLDTSCSTDWYPIIMVLGTMTGLLFVTCAALITKILQLKKRPRIKRRIIVNKNVTPLTARPDQCEITIENCCNMNICETPCYEPRNTIRPTLLDAKPGKEEKRNLIANMENPEDPY